MEGGAITRRYDKRLLPTYDVFDEDRYFVPGVSPVVIDVAGVRVGLSVCEDLWRGEDAGNGRRYMERASPVEALVREGAELIVNASASPFVLGKARKQRDLLVSHVKRHTVAVATVNQVGANDDLIFDGHASVHVPMNGGRSSWPRARYSRRRASRWSSRARRRVLGDAAEASDMLIEACEESARRGAGPGRAGLHAEDGVFRGVPGHLGRDRLGADRVIAARAMGPENVIGIMMPSRYSSPGSVTDAERARPALGIRAHEAPIKEQHDASERRSTVSSRTWARSRNRRA